MDYDGGDCTSRSDGTVAEAKEIYSKDHPMFPTKTEVSSRLEGECLAYSGPQVDDCGVCYGDNLDKDCAGDCFGSAVVCEVTQECVENQDDCYPLGDVNFDEVLNILDITSLQVVNYYC